MKKCPFCAEEIQDDAVKCKHCGEWFKVRNAEDQGIKNSKINAQKANGGQVNIIGSIAPVFKLILTSLIITICIIASEFFLGFICPELTKAENYMVRLAIALVLFSSFGIIISLVTYKKKRTLVIFIVSAAFLIIFRWIFASIIFDGRFLSLAIANTLREIGIIFIPAIICVYLLRRFEGKFKFAELKDIKVDDVSVECPTEEGNTDEAKYDTAICTNCGKRVKISTVRFLSFLGKGEKDFCENCGIFLRDDPFRSMLWGIALVAISLTFIIVRFLNYNPNSSSVQNIFLLAMAYGVFDGCKKIFSGIRVVIKSISGNQLNRAGE